MKQKLGGRMRYRDLGPAAAIGHWGSISGRPIGGNAPGDAGQPTVVAALAVFAAPTTTRQAEVAQAVIDAGGSVTQAARRLGISRQRVYQVLGVREG